METPILFIGALLLIVAFLGCFVPVLPGPTIAYAAILVRHFFSESSAPYSTTLLVVMGVAMAVVFLLDYIIPGWITRRVGGSKYGARGALIGMIAGIIFTPIGMLVGMFLGALIGELLHDSDSFGRAFRIACWSFVGFLLTVGVKCIYCIAATWKFFSNG
ncbi:MAG: DUF456 domain-containing protein [Prevotellaceae bacterium]|jgi:uncharacterized protein YqgC (DUF456 family)|nr:DUF456 domain-containing protein [Prevotellaceae bacterium]